MTRSVRNLMAGVAMTAAERSTGRYMRAPDGHEGGGDGGTGGAGGGSGGSGTDLGSLDLPDTVEDLNSIAPKLRGLYVPDGGKFKYSDPLALRSAHERTKQERNAFRERADKASVLDELGLTPEQVKELKTQADQRAADKAKEEGDFNSLKEQMETNFKTERDKWSGREKKLTTALENNLVDAAVTKALTEPGLEGNPTLLLPHLRGRVKVVETEDGFERQVLLADGKTPMLGADNKPATIKDLLTEFKTMPEFAAAFKGNNQSGGGSSGGSGGGGTTGTKKRSEMSAVERVAFIKEHGQDKYLSLPA